MGLLSACLSNPNDPSHWIKKLRDKREQKTALAALVRINDPVAVPALIDWYRDAQSGRPEEVLDAIIHFHDPRSIPVLIDSLDYSDQDSDRATKAAEELGRLQAKQAIAPLATALGKPVRITSRANLVKHASIRALARIKDPADVEPLCKIVRALPDEQDLFLNKVAALALGEIADAKAIGCLLPAAFISRADGANVFQDVRLALAKIGSASVDPLIELLDEKNTEVQALAKKLDFVPGIVPYKAAYLLGDQRSSKAVPALLRRLKEPPRGDMHRSIVVALGQIGQPAGVEAVMAVLKDGKQPETTRQSACEALVAARATQALPALLAIAKDRKAPESVQTAAAMALGRLGAGAEHQAFASLAGRNETFGEVAERLKVGQRCGPKNDACYAKALDDSNLIHQEKAAFMLGMASDPAAARTALGGHLAAPEPIVRLAVLDSVRRVAAKRSSVIESKLQELISREEKLSKIPAFALLVAEMKVTLASLQHLPAQ